VEKQTGIGCAQSCADRLAANVYRFLCAGSPRLAWAAANGIPLARWRTAIVTTFDTTAPASKTGVQNQTKIVQDILIDRVSYHIQNRTPIASDFDAMANWFFERESGIITQLRVTGAPRYLIDDEFVPISEIAEPREDWILQPTNGLLMDFQSTITLPSAPMDVSVVFHGLTTTWIGIIGMSNNEAIAKLQAMGFDCGPYAGQERLCG